MADKTIRVTYDMPEVESRMLAPTYYKESRAVSPETIFGLELEIEGFRPTMDQDARFTYEADGSLRNSGIELISRPTRAKHIEEMLTAIYKKHSITEENYSERCSTHVHMNVQDFTWDNLKVLVMLYQMFERLLFAFVGGERKDNIFCVPWHESGLTYSILDKMGENADGSVRQWQKYSALNLLPIRSQGTVEFRHMYGTCSVPFIMSWIGLLSRMALYAKANTAKSLKATVLEMNTISNYDQFMSDVFGEDRGILMISDYQAALSVGVIDTKLMLLKPPVPKKATLNFDTAELNQLYNETLNRTARVVTATVNPFNAIYDDVIPARLPTDRVQTTEGAMTRADILRLNQWRIENNFGRPDNERMALIQIQEGVPV